MLLAPPHLVNANRILETLGHKARAREARISCWTVDQLAAVVKEAEARQISAERVLKIVLTAFAPTDVEKEVEKLLTEPTWATQALYQRVLQGIRDLEDRLTDSPRTVDQIAAEVTRDEAFKDVSLADITHAVTILAGASQGGIALRGDRIVLNVSYDEVDRRLSGLTGQSGVPRRTGKLRKR